MGSKVSPATAKSSSTPSRNTRSQAGAAAVAKMAPSTLDLLMLTFNCAKNLINVSVFAHHLQSALSQNAARLPDLVVFSLQEVAPLGQSFVGGYFLNPYFARFEDALNLAALRIDNDNHDKTDGHRTKANGDAGSGSRSTEATADQPQKHYSLIKSGNVGYTAILLFARDPDRIKSIQEAEVGFGAADMGNKGACGLRILFHAGAEEEEEEETEVTFVATHLAAMEWNLAKRNANWAAILRGMAFENPEKVVDRHRASSAGHADDSPDEQHPLLLHQEHDEQHQRLQRQLHDISIFKPSSHFFVAGDLNYRISSTSPPPGSPFPSLDPNSENYYTRFWPLDQLTRERKAGRTLHGLSEAAVTFPPTYKYDIKPGTKDEDLQPEWSFAPHRYPSWTDRVLYLDTPGNSDNSVEVITYDALPIMTSSDHRPVFLRASIPLIAPAAMESLVQQSDDEISEVADPRRRLPAELDPEAWERRAAARNKERMVGWSMILWSTKEGAAFLGSLFFLGAGWYYLARGWPQS